MEGQARPFLRGLVFTSMRLSDRLVNIEFDSGGIMHLPNWNLKLDLIDREPNWEFQIHGRTQLLKHEFHHDGCGLLSKDQTFAFLSDLETSVIIRECPGTKAGMRNVTKQTLITLEFRNDDDSYGHPTPGTGPDALAG